MRTDSDDSRMRSSTVAILSTNWLKDWPICASSSRPAEVRRRVRSPSPEAMSCSASRATARRLSMRRSATVSSTAAPSTDSTVMRAATCSSARTESVACARSITTASVQGVPSTLAA